MRLGWLVCERSLAIYTTTAIFVNTFKQKSTLFVDTLPLVWRICP
ncbi:hypothetical protein HMPREF3198_01156 [Winkia neuii]|nr:hypothetical protein HMPREF3198_01156 [Winkia neuii]